MSFTRLALGLAVASAALFAPSAQASFPYTCDTVRCFAEWCANNAGDCTDGDPRWYHCRPGQGCIGGQGDVTRYVAYCTVIAGPVACVK